MRLVNCGWLLSIVTLCVAACSGVKTYSNESRPNFVIHTQVESGSVARSTVAEFDIFDIESACSKKYLGRVYLDNATTNVAIAPGRATYLEFIFASKTFMSNTTYATRYGTVLTPRADYDYDVQVRYVNAIYSVLIRETRHGSTTSRIIERKPLDVCR